jgi:hypothetical protein
MEEREKEERHEDSRKGKRIESEIKRNYILSILIAVSVCSNYGHSIMEHCDRGFDSRQCKEVSAFLLLLCSL